MVNFPILKLNAKPEPFLGIGILTNTIECFVTEKRNDAFYLEMKCKNDNDIAKELKVGRIIKAYAGEELGDQHFRIYDIKKDIKGNIDVTAEHVFFDLEKIPVVKKKYLERPVKEILNNLLQKDAVITGHGFVTETDINETISVDFGFNSVKECLMGTNGSILDGLSTTFELIRTNQTIKLKKVRGKEQPVILSYTKNIDDFKCIENRDTAYTHLFPYIVKTNDEGNEEIILCNPKAIMLREYEGGAVNVLEKDYTNDVIWETKEMNSTNLYNHAKKYADKIKRESPFKYEVNLSSIVLKSDEDFKNIGIGDTFKLYNKMYDLFIKVKVIEITFDCLSRTPIKAVLEEV